MALPFVSAGDLDQDGIDDSQDDCPVAAGTSTVDRNGCPDRDGDGTSDRNDPWAVQGGGFNEDSRQAYNDDYYISLFSEDDNYYMTSDGDYLRIWNTSLLQNVKSVNIGGIYDVAWSPDGNYVAAVDDSDQLLVYYTSNVSNVYTVSVDVGSGDQALEVEYSPDGTMIAVVIGRSGNSGTNGEVQIYDSYSGTELTTFNPSSADRFYSVDWSPDGSRIVIGGREDVWVYTTDTWTQNASRNTNRGSINSIAWSPDGHSIGVCEAWESSGARIRMLDYPSMNERWVYTTSTSCNDIEFSPDSTQVAAGHTYYQSDGASIRIFETHASTANIIDTLSAPRPGGCSSSGGGNGCGSIYGLDWHSNGMYIISAHGRNDEGIYHWKVDPDIDNDGVLNENDAFPEEGTQWDDTDGDGYGDNSLPAYQGDACPTTFGSSWQDRFGCPDGDGDGYSDDGDAFPIDSTQWADADSDGHGDNYYYDVQPLTELHLNQSGDAFPMNPSQWNDTDGDNYGDNYANSDWTSIRPAEWPGSYDPSATGVDKFPIDRYQWADNDDDWIGNEPATPRSDGCINTWGNSSEDRLGCPDNDGDGWSNPTPDFLAHPDGDADAFPDDPTQWRDSDGDGFGDNTTGNSPDDCPGEYGTSSIDRVGCPDADNDGYSNSGDPFPTDGTQWEDRDGDNYGDNPQGNDPDAFPDDSSQWADRDGDGYGDRAIPGSGDFFPDDPTQWADFDGDGYGDNSDGNNGDMCPELYGESTIPEARGCPDTDNDGVVDPFDAFPQDYYQQTDNDGDGFGDNQAVPNGDECPQEYGTSTNNSRQGCPDMDGDSWADVDDDFPEDPKQWKDTDLDGWGDNYGWTNQTIADEQNPGEMITIRDQWGDAFVTDITQWSDMDGDGFGDNNTGRLPDAFPMRDTQWADTDGDGFGDNQAIGVWQPDECQFKYGTSYIDYFGCVDSDEDGVSDLSDPCPYDSSISQGLKSQVDCAYFDDADKDGIPDEFDSDFISSKNDGWGDGIPTSILILIALTVFLLAVIVVAMMAKQAGKRKLAGRKAEEMKVSAMFQEEEARKQEWIEYYVAQGEVAKAMELGWTPPAEVPQWQLHQEQQQSAQEAAIPTMLDLDKL
ncbi:MAG: hypothetical protein QGI21_05445 [Candidatus Poseidoniaceae archaeon]|jgi:hypothetical protein|nr:hypothetical protein [Candidatus Poseidoniaceae archaeon]